MSDLQNSLTVITVIRLVFMRIELLAAAVIGFTFGRSVAFGHVHDHQKHMHTREYIGTVGNVMYAYTLVVRLNLRHLSAAEYQALPTSELLRL